jgi:hypothetical protein
MTDFFAWLLSTRFMPHGHCLLWDSDVVLLHVVSDSLITLAYYSIPLTLLHFTRRRQDLPYPWVFYCFGAFIVACGTTHLIGVVNVWVPAYRLDGMVKAVTASLSVTTAAILIPLVPKALALRSPVQLEEANEQLDAANRRLAAANRALEQEVARRQDVERELQATSDDLRRSTRTICRSRCAASRAASRSSGAVTEAGSTNPRTSSSAIPSRVRSGCSR